LAPSSNFAVENGFGESVVSWIREYVQTNNAKFEVKNEEYSLISKNFGIFEIISWKGDWNYARKIILKASKKMKIKVIDPGYHEKNNLLMSFIGASKEYGKVFSKGSFVGIVTLGVKSGRLVIKDEKRSS
jgi:hypothetical protein